MQCPGDIQRIGYIEEGNCIRDLGEVFRILRTSQLGQGLQRCDHCWARLPSFCFWLLHCVLAVGDLFVTLSQASPYSAGLGRPAKPLLSQKEFSEMVSSFASADAILHWHFAGITGEKVGKPWSMGRLDSNFAAWSPDYTSL